VLTIFMERKGEKGERNRSSTEGANLVSYIGRALWEVSPAAEETRQKRETREKSGGNTPLREERDIWSLDPQGVDGHDGFPLGLAMRMNRQGQDLAQDRIVRCMMYVSVYSYRMTIMDSVIYSIAL
jgi:hypothetical protein